jgi:hypothetical protein
MDMVTLIGLIVEQVMRSSVQFGQAGQARSNLQPWRLASLKNLQETRMKLVKSNGSTSTYDSMNRNQKKL